MADVLVRPQVPAYEAIDFHANPSLPGYRNDVIAKGLPGFPTNYSGARVWTGAEMLTKSTEWLIELSDKDNHDILEAFNHFKGSGRPLNDLSPETFPLPDELHQRLRNISQDCYNGRGFCVLRGLNNNNYAEEDLSLVFGGVTSHVASIRGFQTLHRTIVTCHVYSNDTKPDKAEKTLRPAFTNGRLAFHTDLGDLLTLFSKDVSDNGGETLIASSSHIYNEMAAKYPDLLQELAKDWVFCCPQNYNTDRTPLMSNTPDDQLIFQYSRLPVTGFRGTGGNPTIPSPTPQRLEAMAVLENLCRENAMALPRQRGDIAFINNMCLMHGRTAYDVDVDGNSLPSKRHLIKLMLRDPELAWKLPEASHWINDLIFGPNKPDGSRFEEWQAGPVPPQPPIPLANG